jgi:hypothetical protein
MLSQTGIPGSGYRDVSLIWTGDKGVRVPKPMAARRKRLTW